MAGEKLNELILLHHDLVTRQDHLDECLDELKEKLLGEPYGVVPVLQENVKQLEQKLDRLITILAVMGVGVLGGGALGLQKLTTILGILK